MNRVILLLTAPLIAFSLFLDGCGGGLDQQQENDATGSTSVSLGMQWPEGYRYDRSAGALYPPAGRAGASVPSYVTRVGLRIDGPGMDTLLFNVPLDTLTVQATVTFGPRTFSALVETNIGVSFTGEATAMVTPHGSPEVLVSLEVNGPPIIETVQMSNSRPRKNEAVTLRAIASDPDPDDRLTYDWRGTGPKGHSQSWSGESITVPGDHFGGTYSLNLTVTDGHGGVAETSRSFVIQNSVPVASGITFSNPYVPRGATTTATCNATDRDGDRLEYTWSGSGGLSGITATGKSVDIQIPQAAFQGGTLTCTVTDGDRNSVATVSDHYYFLRGIITGGIGLTQEQADIKMIAPDGTTAQSFSPYDTCLRNNRVKMRGFLPGGTYRITSFAEKNVLGNVCTGGSGTTYDIRFEVDGAGVNKKTGIADGSSPGVPFLADTRTATIQ